MTPFIDVSRVSRQYTTPQSAIHAVDDVSLKVEKGEFICLIGPSGCGKSTLLSIIGGLTVPSSGQVKIGGQVVTQPMPGSVAFMFQDYSLLPWRRAIDNVELGLQIRGVKRDRRRAIARNYLELVGLAEFDSSFPAQLSGGMQQRVAIARALALEPDILLFDEPFGALDELTRIGLGGEVMRLLSRSDATAIFVTHSLSEATYLADRIVVMSASPGQIRTVVPVDEPRPRVPEFRLTKRFHEIHDYLFELLKDDVMRESKGLGPQVNSRAGSKAMGEAVGSRKDD